jgi:hypothetical protein
MSSMGEPPINSDDLGEPGTELLHETEFDHFAAAEIESRIDAIEMRDAQSFSARTNSSASKRGARRNNNKAAKRPTGKRRSSRPSGDGDGDDAGVDAGGNSLFRSGRFGTLRAGLVLTIFLTLISIIGCLFIFIINSGPKLAPTNVTITPPEINSNYTVLVPPPPSKPTPPVKPTRLHLAK